MGEREGGRGVDRRGVLRRREVELKDEGTDEEEGGRQGRSVVWARLFGVG